jgi:hypothetical protein
MLICFSPSHLFYHLPKPLTNALPWDIYNLARSYNNLVTMEKDYTYFLTGWQIRMKTADRTKKEMTIDEKKSTGKHKPSIQR